MSGISDDQIKLTDKIVGNNMRKRRLELGLTQQEVSKVIGVSIQQLQKYEKNINRISSGKLNSLAIFLEVPINYFFQQSNYDHPDFNAEKNYQKQTLALVKAFHSIKGNLYRNKILEFLQFLSSN